MSKNSICSPEFSGFKVALFFGEQLVVIQRDVKPGLPFAGLWDFPGGGRENEESILTCAIREIHEELGILLTPQHFIWQKQFNSELIPTDFSYFLVAHIDALLLASIHFGKEGQT